MRPGAVKREIDTTHRAYFLRSLEGGVYTIQVSAGNKAGHGVWSEAVKVELPVQKANQQKEGHQTAMISTKKEMARIFEVQHARKSPTAQVPEKVHRSLVNSLTQYAWVLQIATL